MPMIPPIEDEKFIRNTNRPSGKLEKLLCKKCAKLLTLRDVNIVGNKIYCKKCNSLVLEVKD